MKDFEIHVSAMFELVKNYAIERQLVEEMSALLIVREVSKPQQPGAAAPATPQPMQMAIHGETPDVALGTIHYAAQILTNEIRDTTKKRIGSEPQG
jgi:hypothetical protein